MESNFPTVQKNEQQQTSQSVEEQRAIAQVQGQVLLAKKFPRDQLDSYNRIIDMCKRKGLAEHAIYAYPKGGQMVTGPSIRLAEAVAQEWGNMDYGVVELEQLHGHSRMMAYAWDLERNVRRVMNFTVVHKRTARGQVKDLTDSRDIYELTANQGARRVRACILAVIPGDVVEDAQIECEKTIQRAAGDEPISEVTKKLIVVFNEFGVKPKHLETKLGHKLDAIIPAEIVQLRKIYKSIKDGMATREEFFEIGLKTPKMPTPKSTKPKKGQKAETNPLFDEWSTLLNKMGHDQLQEFERDCPCAIEFKNLQPDDQTSRLNELKNFLGK